MSINLSDLTSPNNQDVLAEITSGAELLDPIGKLKNLSRGANAGGHALQTTALNQPRALPLIKNPQGNLGGYLYIPNVAGNYATGPSVTIGSNQTWEGELDMVITQWGNWVLPMGGGDWDTGFGLIFYPTGYVRTFSKGSVGTIAQSGVTLGTPFNAKFGFDGTNLYVDIDDSRVYELVAPDQSGSITHALELNQQALITNVGNYAIQKAKLTVNSAVVFDCDFNGSTSIRHGDTKFNCVGGPVSLTKAGNDPITVVKKSVLRFANQSDGSTNIALQGLLNQTITGGYMFAAFSVLGDGGASYGNLFSVRKDFQGAGGVGSFTFFRDNVNNNIRLKYNNAGSVVVHQDIFDDTLGDILLESELQSGSQISKVNNANEDNGTTSVSGALSSVKFEISADTSGSTNVSYDLEYLALFPSLTNEQATKIRDYINKRNQIYLRHQTDGFYFFNPQKLAAGDVTSWNGNITGSDLGDTDVATNVTIVQGSQTSQPNADGYSLTFEDNTQHLEWASAYTPNFPAGQTKAWQIVGTSLGTFAYLTQGSVSELNLLGNLGNASHRKAGDLYGVMLLPESATGAEIEAARKLLIDRGSLDGSLEASYFTAWLGRIDIVEFKSVDLSNATSVQSAWQSCTSMTTFPALNLSSSTTLSYSWYSCSGLSNFGAIQAPVCTDFSNAWLGTAALTSFPAGAKLGTSASNVSFSSAWQDSGLTSFPDLDLSSGTTFFRAWQSSDLISFPANIDLSGGTDFTDAWRNINTLLSFPAGLNLSSGQTFDDAWRSCTSLTGFPLINISSGKRFRRSWYNCSSMSDWPSGFFDSWSPSDIFSGVFDDTWDGCVALSSTSVENILVSINNSGKYGTATGAAGGGAIDSGIDIDYNGDPLSAATNTAVDSLKAKGWVIVVNGVTL